MSNRSKVSVTVKTSGPATVKVIVKPEGTKRRPLAVIREEERGDVGGFSEPSKMPWLSWSTPAERCQVGSRLREVAGSTCSGCYAMKGNYAWPGVKVAQERRFEKLADLPAWTDSMVEHITERAARFTPTDGDAWPAFRWHDSGDVQSVEHLAAICEIAERTQDVLLADGTVEDVHYWLPTREYGYITEYLKQGGAIPRNLCIRLSGHMKDGPAPSKFGLPVSTVHTSPDSYSDAVTCPAYTQGGKCLSCRSCWDNNVPHVSYPAH